MSFVKLQGPALREYKKYQGRYDVYREIGMPEDVRRLFSLRSRFEQAEQQEKVASAAKADFKDQMDKILQKVTDTGGPIVAKLPCGRTFVLYREKISDDPQLEEVKVVNL